MVAHVYNNEYGGTDKEIKIEIVKGTASGSPAPPPVPPTALKLARWNVIDDPL